MGSQKRIPVGRASGQSQFFGTCCKSMHQIFKVKLLLLYHSPFQRGRAHTELICSDFKWIRKIWSQYFCAQYYNSRSMLTRIYPFVCWAVWMQTTWSSARHTIVVSAGLGYNSSNNDGSDVRYVRTRTWFFLSSLLRFVLSAKCSLLKLAQSAQSYASGVYNYSSQSVAFNEL